MTMTMMVDDDEGSGVPRKRVPREEENGIASILQHNYPIAPRVLDYLAVRGIANGHGYENLLKSIPAAIEDVANVIKSEVSSLTPSDDPSAPLVDKLSSVAALNASLHHVAALFQEESLQLKKSLASTRDVYESRFEQYVSHHRERKSGSIDAATELNASAKALGKALSELKQARNTYAQSFVPTQRHGAATDDMVALRQDAEVVYEEKAQKAATASQSLKAIAERVTPELTESEEVFLTSAHQCVRASLVSLASYHSRIANKLMAHVQQMSETGVAPCYSSLKETIETASSSSQTVTELQAFATHPVFDTTDMAAVEAWRRSIDEKNTRYPPDRASIEHICKDPVGFVAGHIRTLDPVPHGGGHENASKQDNDTSANAHAQQATRLAGVLASSSKNLIEDSETFQSGEGSSRRDSFFSDGEFDLDGDGSHTDHDYEGGRDTASRDFSTTHDIRDVDTDSDDDDDDDDDGNNDDDDDDNFEFDEDEYTGPYRRHSADSDEDAYEETVGDVFADESEDDAAAREIGAVMGNGHEQWQDSQGAHPRTLHETLQHKRLWAMNSLDSNSESAPESVISPSFLQTHTPVPLSHEYGTDLSDGYEEDGTDGVNALSAHGSEEPRSHTERVQKQQPLVPNIVLSTGDTDSTTHDTHAARELVRAEREEFLDVDALSAFTTTSSVTAKHAASMRDEHVLPNVPNERDNPSPASLTGLLQTSGPQLPLRDHANTSTRSHPETDDDDDDGDDNDDEEDEEDAKNAKGKESSPDGDDGRLNEDFAQIMAMTSGYEDEPTRNAASLSASPYPRQPHTKSPHHHHKSISQASSEEDLSRIQARDGTAPPSMMAHADNEADVFAEVELLLPPPQFLHDSASTGQASIISPTATPQVRAVVAQPNTASMDSSQVLSDVRQRIKSYQRRREAALRDNISLSARTPASPESKLEEMAKTQQKQAQQTALETNSPLLRKRSGSSVSSVPRSSAESKKEEVLAEIEAYKHAQDHDSNRVDNAVHTSNSSKSPRRKHVMGGVTKKDGTIHYRKKTSSVFVMNDRRPSKTHPPLDGAAHSASRSGHAKRNTPPDSPTRRSHPRSRSGSSESDQSSRAKGKKPGSRTKGKRTEQRPSIGSTAKAPFSGVSRKFPLDAGAEQTQGLLTDSTAAVAKQRRRNRTPSPRSSRPKRQSSSTVDPSSVPSNMVLSVEPVHGRSRNQSATMVKKRSSKVAASMGQPPQPHPRKSSLGKHATRHRASAQEQQSAEPQQGQRPADSKKSRAPVDEKESPQHTPSSSTTVVSAGKGGNQVKAVLVRRDLVQMPAFRLFRMGAANAEQSQPAEGIAIALVQTINASFKAAKTSMSEMTVFGDIVLGFTPAQIDALRARLNRNSIMGVKVMRASSSKSQPKRMTVESVSQPFVHDLMPYVLIEVDGAYDYLTSPDAKQTQDGLKIMHCAKVRISSKGDEAPVRLKAMWRCDRQLSTVRIEFAAMPALQHVLTGASIHLPCKRARKVTTSPPSDWDPQKKEVVWNIGTIVPSADKYEHHDLTAKIDVSHSGRPMMTKLRFHSFGHAFLPIHARAATKEETLLAFTSLFGEAEGAACTPFSPKLSDPVHQCQAGKYFVQ